MTLEAINAGFIDQIGGKPPSRGVRVAAYVTAYLNDHPGLSPGELAFRLRADKRDLLNLLNAESCGWKLEDKLAGYFGSDFVEAIFAPVVGTGRSRREKELEIELAAISARRAAIERDRALRRRARASFETPSGLVPGSGRGPDV